MLKKKKVWTFLLYGTKIYILAFTLLIYKLGQTAKLF